MTAASGNEQGVGPAADPTVHLTSGAWVGEWVLDPGRSSVRFRSTSLWGLVKVNGRFSGLRGEGSLSPDGSVAGVLVIDSRSVGTGNTKRDHHLRSDDFFHATTHPEITYVVSGMTPMGTGRVRVKGDLTVLDHTRALELDATLEEANANGASVVATTELDRSAWGITFRKMGMTKMATGVDARLHFTRPA